MNLELHLGSAALGEAVKALVEDRFLSRDVGFAGMSAVPWPSLLSTTGSAQVVVDHVKVRPADLGVRRGASAVNNIALPPPPGGARGSLAVPTQQIGIDVVVDLYLVRITDLQAAGTVAVPEESMMKAQARIELKLAQPVLMGTTLSIGLTVDRISLGFADAYPASATLPPAAQALAARLNAPALLASFAVPPLTVNTADLTSLLGDGFTGWNAGARVEGGALLVRLQLEPASVTDRFGLTAVVWSANWRSFHQSARSRLNGREWALFLPARFFADEIDSTIETSLAGRTDFVINDDNRPNSTWSVTPPPPMGALCNPDGQAGITTRFSAAAIGACRPWGMDVDVNITIPVSITMPSSGAVRVQLQLRYEPDPGDMALCGILNSHLTAGAGLAIGGALGGWVGAVIGAVVGGLGGGITTVVAGYELGAPSIARGDLMAIEGEEDAYYQELTIPTIRNETLGQMSLDALVPCTDGLTLVGSIATPAERLPTLWQVEKLEFRWWLVDGSCPPQEPVVRASIDGRVSLGSASVPLVLWGAPVILGAPDGYQDAVNVRVRGNPANYGVDLEFGASAVRSLRSSMADTLDPVRVLIQSNAGARVITLRPMDESLSDEAMAETRDRQTRICEARRARREDFEHWAGDLIEVLRERLGHLPEIPSGWPPGAFLWNVRVAGLEMQDTVRLGSLRNGDFSATHTLPADARGGVFARMWQRRDCNEPHLAMHIASKQSKPGCAEGGMVVSLSHFVAVARIPVFESVVTHRLFQSSACLQLGVVTDDGVLVYDLVASGKPRITHRVRQLGVSNLMPIKGGLALWGGGGASVLRRGDELIELTRSCVRQAEREGNELRLDTAAGPAHFRMDGSQVERSCPTLVTRPTISVTELGDLVATRVGDVAVARQPGDSELIVLARDQTASS